MSAAFELAIRALVLLIAASAAAALLRYRSASLRAFVWTVALAGLLVLPVISLVMPEWRVEVWAEAAPPTAVPAAEVVRRPLDPADVVPVRGNGLAAHEIAPRSPRPAPSIVTQPSPRLRRSRRRSTGAPKLSSSPHSSRSSCSRGLS